MEPRRIETPTGETLLRSARVPIPTEACALLSSFAAGHVGTAPLRLQYAMLSTRADAAVTVLPPRLSAAG